MFWVLSTPFANYRFSFRFVPFRFANYSEPSTARSRFFYSSEEFLYFPTEFNNNVFAILKIKNKVIP